METRPKGITRKYNLGTGPIPVEPYISHEWIGEIADVFEGYKRISYRADVRVNWKVALDAFRRLIMLRFCTERPTLIRLPGIIISSPIY